MVPSLNFYYTTSWSSLGEGYCRFFWTFNDDLIIVLRFINSNPHQYIITTRRVFSISSTLCPTPATLLSAWTASCPKLPLPPSHSTHPSYSPYTCIALSTDLLTSLTSAGPFPKPAWVTQIDFLHKQICGTLCFLLRLGSLKYFIELY